MAKPAKDSYVSRAGDKLAAALEHFRIDVTGFVCADLGSQVGGFIDCLLRRGAAKVYSVDTCYGTLAWKLRRDPRVVVLERTNAMHVSLPECVDLVTIDVGWTPQAKILPNVAGLIRPDAHVVTLLKPHYEADSTAAARHNGSPLVDGVLPDEAVDQVVGRVLRQIEGMGWTVHDTLPSPIRGHGGNREAFAQLTRPGTDV